MFGNSVEEMISFVQAYINVMTNRQVVLNVRAIVQDPKQIILLQKAYDVAMQYFNGAQIILNG